MLPEDDDLRDADPALGHLDQVPHLLLRPHQDDLPGILFAEPVPEPPVVLRNIKTSSSSRGTSRHHL